uniref:hypothetical protein n=1 Tax=Bacillus ndiopicus TaxID=1347368 RepID=UPI001E48DBF7
TIAITFKCISHEAVQISNFLYAHRIFYGFPDRSAKVTDRNLKVTDRNAQIPDRTTQKEFIRSPPKNR